MKMDIPERNLRNHAIVIHRERMQAADRVLRAMTDDGAFRTIAARTTDTVRGVLNAQQVDGDLATRLGEMVTGAILFRETMAPKLRVQGVLRGSNHSGQIIADSHPEGWARGLIQRNEEAPPFQLGRGSMLQMMRSLPTGDLHQGVIEVPTGGGINEALMGYMQQSEQIVSMVRVCVQFSGPRLVAAGGYLVQVLPEAPDREGQLMLMAQRLEDDFSDIGGRLTETDASPNHLIEEIFFGMPFTYLGDSELRAGCDCSRVRVMASLATLGRDELRTLIDDGSALDMSCDWCGTPYRVELAQLRGLLSAS